MALLHGDLLLSETVFTLMGAMASITIVILQLKLSTSSVTETPERAGMEEKS